MQDKIRCPYCQSLLNQQFIKHSQYYCGNCLKKYRLQFGQSTEYVISLKQSKEYDEEKDYFKQLEIRNKSFDKKSFWSSFVPYYLEQMVKELKLKGRYRVWFIIIFLLILFAVRVYQSERPYIFQDIEVKKNNERLRAIMEKQKKIG
ncbi:hypothetical protein FHQ26_08015 [Testudinibacter sp. TR-2022]|uniref:hypothetical protein n=1 Tax=Testudinibacter sp. TR-2022 TaxID=2585029 RepID=UPI00111A9330|nr:hypothetical protein [Testudinibacter sp. TR-2022]TNH08665.1 hypothetical protein FHQ26_08015 [Testudinibacter sp. TR-2022]TNH08748.1 hypothetical protein FHQ25_08975 [Testudinibacter sp. TR-2022]TNH13304.1 hypothetical protein FHQ23_12110 [Testudinibacter sp. TR-2022]TNH14832.1 hypothetical protein FIA56_04520 [Testudinibacter sp. TR-2022]